MKTINQYINKDNFENRLGSISFQLDEASMKLLSLEFRKMITEGYHIEIDNMISEMSKYDYKLKKDKNHGFRTIWRSNDDDGLKISSHATEREDRPTEKGGDGEHINEEEIINMFRYAWDDIIDMYYEGELEKDAGLDRWVIQCKCYLERRGDNIRCNGARPENKYLWAVWVIRENYTSRKIDITIITLFRGTRLNHTRRQLKLTIATNGYIKKYI